MRQCLDENFNVLYSVTDSQNATLRGARVLAFVLDSILLSSSMYASQLLVLLVYAVW